MSEYFRFELLSRLPAAEATFLKHTSVLDRMCGGSSATRCSRRRDRHRCSRRSARANGFVVPLDRRGEWYRYHHLFGELLRDELERSEPELVSALNARAMAWCIGHDLPEEAIAYGLAAGETEIAAGLVDALTLPLYYDGRMETAEEWLGWFGDAELVRYPALAVSGAWFGVLTGAAQRGRAVARSRRRSNLDDPALGR